MRLPDPRGSYAVLIGASTYLSDKLADLPAVRNNLTGLAEVLTDSETGCLPPERCAIVADWGGVRAAYRTLRSLARRAEDTLIVYFAGHGLVEPMRNELYLTLADTDPDELPVSALAAEAVRDVFLGCPAANRVLILDCCFSGRAIEGFMASPAEAVLGQAEIAGTYTLASTSANSTAIAPPGATYTAFTGELLSLLRNGIADGPELLSLSTIYRQLRRTLPARGMPIPHQRGTETADQLALARNVALIPRQSGGNPYDEPTGPIPIPEVAQATPAVPAVMSATTTARTMPFWVNMSLIIILVIALGMDAFVLIRRLGQPDYVVQAPPSSTVTTTTLVASGNPSRLSTPSQAPTSLSPPPVALDVATRWAKAWVNHPQGVTNQQWLDGLRPYTTEEQLAVMSTVDPANIPATAVTGNPVVKSSYISSVEVTIATNAGTLSLTVIDTQPGWRVAGYDKAG